MAKRCENMTKPKKLKDGLVIASYIKNNVIIHACPNLISSVSKMRPRTDSKYKHVNKK